MEESASLEGPQEPISLERYAVYRCFAADGRLLYVGTSGLFGRRLADHAQKIWFLEVRGITLEWYPSGKAAEAAERRAIHVEQPKYNLIHKNGRLCPLPGATRKPAAQPPTPPLSPVAVRKVEFARALDNATGKGVSPRALMLASGLGRTFIHELLGALVEGGVIVQVARGCYRTMPGQSAEAAVSSGRIP